MATRKSELITVTVKGIPKKLWQRTRKAALDREEKVGEVVAEALGRMLDGKDGKDGKKG